MGSFYTIPATENFSDTLVHYIDDLAAKDNLSVSKIKIYVPTRRSIRTLKEAFLRRSNGKPRILPIIQAVGDSDTEEMSFLTPHAPEIPPAMDPTQRQVILARFLEKAWEGEYNFTNALSIAADLGRLIDQIHTENIPFSNLDTLVEIKEFSEHWNITLSFLKLLLQDLWQTYLDAHGKIDAGLHRRLKIEALTDFYKSSPPEHPVIIAGSTGSHPSTRDLIKTIGSHDHGLIFLPALDQEMDDNTWICVTDGHPQFLLKRLIDHCKISRKNIRGYSVNAPDHNRLFTLSEIMRPAEKTEIWQSLVDPLSQDKINKGIQNITFCACENEEKEARVIALSMAEIAADKTQEKTCVLITPDRNLSARVQSNLKQWGITCDDSAGQTLPHTGIGRFALSVLECEQIEQIHPLSFLSTLKSSFAGGGGFENFRTHLRALEKDALRGLRPHGSIKNLTTHTDRHDDFIDHLSSLFDPLTNLKGGAHSLDLWIAAHITAIENIAKTQNQDGASRLWVGHAGETLATFFEKLGSYVEHVPPLNHKEYIEFIRTMMVGVQTRPPYGTHPRLSILGQIESRMASADRVILSGLNEGTWPPDNGFDAWMSRSMRADFGLPSLEQKTTLAAHDFATALGSAEVFITLSNRKGGQPAQPSRWISRMETMLTAAKISPDLWPHEKGKIYLKWADDLHAPTAIQSAPRPMPKPVSSRRPTKFSITDIERWMRDPYALYAKKILRLRKLDHVDEDVNVADKGTLIHAAMEHFTREFSGELPDDALRELITVGKKLFDAEADNPEIYGLWWPRFEKAAAWVIDHERPWRHHTHKIHAESACELTLSINDVDYTLIGKADRIEQRTGNDWAIIDYKTGGLPEPKNVIAGIANQLPLEAFILNQNGFSSLNAVASNDISLHYWSLSGTGIGGTERIAQGSKGGSGQDLSIEAGDGLKSLITVFSNEDTPYIGSPDSTIMINADYNDFAHLERIAEWSVIDGGDD